MRGRRRAAEDGRDGELARHALDQPDAQPRRQEPEPEPKARPRDALERLLGVRVAAEHARQVERERDARHRQPRREQPLHLDREPPALRRARLEERHGARGPQRLAPARLQERRRPAVQHRLRRGHGDDEVGLDERAVDRDGGVPQLPELDEVVALGVVDDHAAAEAPPELGRDEQADLAWARPPVEAARDEDRHAGDAEPHELVCGRGDRILPRVVGRGRDRQRRLLDDERGRAAAAREVPERLAGEREPQRLGDRGADVVDRIAGRGRPEHRPARGNVRDDEPRAAEQRHASRGAHARFAVAAAAPSATKMPPETSRRSRRARALRLRRPASADAASA